MTHSWDIVIAGAGLAGLSLAAELSAPHFSNLKILLVEPRTEYVRDRTWSFWDVPDALPDLWRALPRTLWQQWRVSSSQRSITRSESCAYASIRADVFYEHALRRVASAPHIEWRKATTVRSAESEQGGIHLVTQDGEHHHAKLLFDSRPPEAALAGQWVQQFKGWEVQTRKPCFDVSCIDLMAFEKSDQGLHFMYCLPYSATQALVESTWIKRSDGAEVQDAELQTALAKRWGCEAYDITFREQGALPLWPAMARKQDRVIRVGRAGGALRASTGYAFCASLHQSAEMAHALIQQMGSGVSLQSWQEPAVQTSAFDAWMDRVLFRVLENDWAAAPNYFLDLFEHVPADVLPRFLHGSASWQDRVKVMNALPAWPFLQAAWKSSR